MNASEGTRRSLLPDCMNITTMVSGIHRPRRQDVCSSLLGMVLLVLTSTRIVVRTPRCRFRPDAKLPSNHPKLLVQYFFANRPMELALHTLTATLWMAKLYGTRSNLLWFVAWRPLRHHQFGKRRATASASTSTRWWSGERRRQCRLPVFKCFGFDISRGGDSPNGRGPGSRTLRIAVTQVDGTCSGRGTSRHTFAASSSSIWSDDRDRAASQH